VAAVVNRVALTIGQSIGAAILGIHVATAALAAEPIEAFPSRAIRIVVPFTPGGGTDLIARKLQPGMQERLKQPVVVENRAGGNARIGANTVAKAEPDGYTVLLTTSGAFVIVPFLGTVAYDPLRDFAPVTLIARSPVLLVAGPRIAVRSIADLVALAKSAPGKLIYASSGVGGPPHLSVELLKQAAGFDMLMVPYSSTGEVNVALLRGDVDVAVGALSAVAPTLQQKDVKALGVTTAKRSVVMPDVPAIAETVPGYEMETWFAVAAPAGTPRPIIDKLRAAVIGALRDPAVAEAVARDGAEISTSTPQELEALMRIDYAKYGALVKSLNIKD
jgi:tripartite-type tricarboxylate transporter receptor subunit TctC